MMARAPKSFGAVFVFNQTAKANRQERGEPGRFTEKNVVFFFAPSASLR